MQKSATLTVENNTLHLSGELDFCNIMAIYEKSLTSFKKGPELFIDFSGLSFSNSAGLALIIEWVKLSEQMKKPIRFKHLSSKLLSIAKAANLDKFVET